MYKKWFHKGKSTAFFSKCDHSNKSFWAVCSVVLFIMRYKVVLTCESVDEILKCDHSNESNWAVLSCVTVYYTVQGSSNFSLCDHLNITEQFPDYEQNYLGVLGPSLLLLMLNFHILEQIFLFRAFFVPRIPREKNFKRNFFSRFFTQVLHIS